MKKRYSVIEISSVAKVSKQAILKRARKEAWVFEEEPNRSGGGKRFFYITEHLPNDIKTALIAQTLNCRQSILPQQNLYLKRVKELIKIWGAATKKNQCLAYARAEIIKALLNSSDSEGIGITDYTKVFSKLYNKRSAPNIDAGIYGIVKQTSPANLNRWKKRFKENGVIGLLDNYPSRKGQRTALAPEESAFIVAKIAEIPHIRPPHLHRLLTNEFSTYSASLTTVRREMNDWKSKNPQLYSMLKNPQEWKNKYRPAHGDASAGIDHMGHTWEIDSTPGDVITADGKRCVIIGIIDVWTRMVELVVADTSNSIAIAVAMRKALLSLGVPFTIRLDNGKDYRSNHTEAIMSVLGIEMHFSLPYSPEQKSHIERFFGTMAISFEELLPRFCGHSVRERQAIRERDTWAAKIMSPGKPLELPLTRDELQFALDTWAHNIYAHQPHGGLGGKTPYSRSKRSKYQPKIIDDERLLDVLLAPISKPRKVQKKGIHIDGIHFYSNELMAFTGLRVRCRQDFKDAGVIYVFRYDNEAFLCKAYCDPLKGEDLEKYIAARKKHEKYLRETSRALKALNDGKRSTYKTYLEGGITADHEDDNIIPLQTSLDTPAIQEARKAVNSDTADVSEPLDIDEPLPAKQQAMDPVSGPWRETDEDRDREFEENMRWAEQQKAVNAE